MAAQVRIMLPDWVAAWLAARPGCATDEERMQLAIDLARENVQRRTGGPFGAAVFEEGATAPLAVGVNAVQVLNNSVVHAEVMALMLAEARLGSYTLRRVGHAPCAIYASCDPCAMCLGAILWSGAQRVVCGADRADAARLGFDEGPVFPESYRYLQERGVAVTHGVLREEGKDVLELYRREGGVIYNA